MKTVKIKIMKSDWKAIKKLSKKLIKNGDTGATPKGLIHDSVRCLVMDISKK